MESIANPIPAKWRNWIYVIALLFGYLTTVATAVLLVVGLTAWTPVLAIAAGGFLTLSSTLARANLNVDTTNTQQNITYVANNASGE